MYAGTLPVNSMMKNSTKGNYKGIQNGALITTRFYTMTDEKIQTELISVSAEFMIVLL